LRLSITIEECLDVSRERVHPPLIGKATERVGETKVQQVDDRLQTVLGATAQSSIPEGPVIVAWFRLAQTPWCAVSNDLDAESGDRAKVVVNMRVVPALRELVLPVGNSIRKHQRIGSFFADGPCKVRESVFRDNCVRHRVANLAERPDFISHACNLLVERHRTVNSVFVPLCTSMRNHAQQRGSTRAQSCADSTFEKLGGKCK
jgi:hypothetical protein